MKKEAIIDLIKSDLEEIGALVETFREPDRIAKDFIELLRQKCDGIGREISLLNYWSSENMRESTTSILAANVPSTAKPQVQQAEIKRDEPQRREEVPDYFADELEDMNDPFADIKIGEPSPAADESSSAAGAGSETDLAIDSEPVVSITSDSPAKAESNATSLKPAIEKDELEKSDTSRHTTASAADIATYGTPVSDVTKAIGINDRFLYQRELFKGSKSDFDSAIAAINASSSYNQAYMYLKQTFGWDDTDATVEAFLKAVHRRFI